MLKPVSSLLTTCFLVVACGCGQPNPSTSSAPPPDPHSHAHDHDQLGPHGGHLVELGNEEYHLEWTHDDDENVVTVFLLDADAKAPYPIEAPAITIQCKVQDVVTYELPAVASSGDPPASAEFSVKDAALLAALKMAGQGAEVTVSVEIGGKSFEGKFEHHDHGHGHQH